MGRERLELYWRLKGKGDDGEEEGMMSFLRGSRWYLLES